MAKNFQNLIDDHRENWGTNESLLQSYRQIFTGSQSFLLAVGAILSSKEINIYFLLIVAISITMIWALWFRIVRVRHLAVDYHKYIYRYLIDRDISNDKKVKMLDKICREKDYLKCCSWENRKKTNQMLRISKNFRPTRIKIDLLLPIAYSIIWFLILLERDFIGYITNHFL